MVDLSQTSTTSAIPISKHQWTIMERFQLPSFFWRKNWRHFLFTGSQNLDTVIWGPEWQLTSVHAVWKAKWGPPLTRHLIFIYYGLFTTCLYFSGCCNTWLSSFLYKNAHLSVMRLKEVTCSLFWNPFKTKQCIYLLNVTLMYCPKYISSTLCL